MSATFGLNKKAIQMKNTKTLYHYIIDRSGSMTSCMPATVNSFKEQLNNLVKLQQEHPEQEFYYSLTIFNDHVDHIISPTAIDPHINEKQMEITPRGSTSLLDAIGLSIQNINDRYGRDIENDEMSVVVMILTDGYENSSRIFTYRDIARLIRQFEETEKWTFSILGADIDIFSIADHLKMNKENVIAFNKSDIHGVFAEYSDAMSDYIKYKRSGRIKKNFLDKILIKDKRKF